MKRSEDWTEDTARLAEGAIGHVFRDKELLKTAFTHTSWSSAAGGQNNERLEFLGDAVLQLCVTERLYGASEEDEGALTQRRQALVSRQALEEAEARAGLMPYLRHVGGENNVNGKTASNLFEAVTAAVYLDGGMGAARCFLQRFLTYAEVKNHRSLLQELVQKRTGETPVYETTGEAEAFECEVRALGASARGKGRSKKAAESAAASALFQILLERTED